MKNKWNSPKDKLEQLQKTAEIKKFKDRINSKITTNRKWVNFVDIGRDSYGIEFQGSDIFIIHQNNHSLIEQVPITTLENIVSQVESGNYFADDTYQW